MKEVKFILLIFLGIILIAGCKVTSNNEKLIIGNWKGGHVNSFIVNQKYASDTNFIASNQLRQNAEVRDQKKVEQESLKEFKSSFKNYTSFKPADLVNMLKSGMEFNTNKTATISTATGSYGGTWKMNAKGDKVTFSDTVTRKKMTIYIAKVDSVRLQIFEKIPTGDLYMTFKK